MKDSMQDTKPWTIDHGAVHERSETIRTKPSQPLGELLAERFSCWPFQLLPF